MKRLPKGAPGNRKKKQIIHKRRITMKKTRKLQLDKNLVLSMEELKDVLGAGNGNQGPEDLLGCHNCDGICQITCAYYSHM